MKRPKSKKDVSEERHRREPPVEIISKERAFRRKKRGKGGRKGFKCKNSLLLQVCYFQALEGQKRSHGDNSKSLESI